MMDRVRNGEPLPQAGQPQQATFTPPTMQQSPVSTQMGVPDDEALSRQLRDNAKARGMAQGNLKTLEVFPGAGSLAGTVQSTDDYVTPVATAQQATTSQAQAQMTSTPDPDIINLAHNNDLTVETLARQAKKKELGENEVVISLR